jgi:DNA repair exonuclease SbcCD ATPase subunit
MTIQEITNEFAGIQANYRLLSGQLEDKKKQLFDLKKKVEIQTKARWVLTEVAQNTQQRFKDKVESLVTMAIQNIYDRPLQFHMEIERKRNKMECRLTVTEIVNGKERVYDDFEEDIAGGLIDVISFACRVVLWSLQTPRSRNVLILDEPMKNMGKLITLGGQVLREISHKLNFQLLIITHEEELMGIADRSYRVVHDGNKSHIQLVKGMTDANIAKKEERQEKSIPRKASSGIKINRGVSL